MDIDALDLKKLRAFHLVARYGSLRSAASRLHITVSAVSFSLRRLEQSLGVELFQRFPNKLVLTAAGQRFAQSVDSIFSGINQALADSALEVTPISRLSVAVNSDLVPYFIPKINTFLKRYPDVDLRIHIQRSSSALRMVESGEIDVGIGHFLKVPPEIHVQPIAESSVSLICTRDHPLAQRKRLRLGDLTGYKVVTLPESHPTRRIITSAFAKAGQRLHSYIEVGNCQTVGNIVEAGIGIGLIHSVCAERNATESLHHTSLYRLIGNLTFSVAHLRNSALSPVFLNALKESLVMP
jgi:DNA-binding transcriptional LysR family regulator